MKNQSSRLNIKRRHTALDKATPRHAFLNAFIQANVGPTAPLPSAEEKIDRAADFAALAAIFNAYHSF